MGMVYKIKIKTSSFTYGHTDMNSRIRLAYLAKSWLFRSSERVFEEPMTEISKCEEGHNELKYHEEKLKLDMLDSLEWTRNTTRARM
jgi:hypothetical protein